VHRPLCAPCYAPAPVLPEQRSLLFLPDTDQQKALKVTLAGWPPAPQPNPPLRPANQLHKNPSLNFILFPSALQQREHCSHDSLSEYLTIPHPAQAYLANLSSSHPATSPPIPRKPSSANSFRFHHTHLGGRVAK